jgi:hypothetical protein
MPDVNLTLSVDQVRALLQISQNQLFRLKFLDPKMPGYKARPGELENVASAIKILEAALKTPTTANQRYPGAVVAGQLRRDESRTDRPPGAVPQPRP